MPLPRNPNAFANSPLDRAGHLRRDAEWLEAAFESEAARRLVLFQGRPLVREEDHWLEPAQGEAAQRGPEARWLFLGLGQDGAPWFAFEASNPDDFAAQGRFDDLRAAARLLSFDDLGPIGCARAVFDWHHRNGFCAKCGTASTIVEAGWKRLCPNCGTEHFPRVDPVAIMLPVLGDRCLLGRQASWPKGMHSALAGFMEPGETIEETVARETLEESGLVVTAVRLHSTQPWPFPSSLMIGAICEVETDAVTIDANELESARWFSREEAAQMLSHTHPDCFCPPPFAIAHQLLKSWVGGA